MQDLNNKIKMNNKTEIKKCMAFIALLFILSSLYGFYAVPRNDGGLEVFEIFKVIIERDNTLLSFAIIIFINNVRTSILSILLGPTFVTPLVITLFNGMLIGSAMANFVNENISLANAMMLIIPHGVFELPAFLLSNSLGLMLGISAFKKYVLKKSEISLMREFSKVATYIKLIITLLLIAAFVEAYITLTLAYLLNLIS